MVQDQTLVVKNDTMYKNGQDDIVLIIGTVNSDTIEYTEGFRFFDGMGILFKEDGTTLVTTQGFDLVAPATDDEIATFKGCKRLFALDRLSERKDLYVSVDSPDFELSMFGRYVNRMGFEVSDPIEHFSRIGRRYERQPSMKDILFRIVV